MEPDKPVMPNLPPPSLGQNNLSNPVIPTPRPRRIKISTIILMILAVIIFAALGSGVYAYVTGWRPFRMQLASDQVISKMLDSLPDVKSAHYDVEVTFKAEPREAGAQPLTVELPELAQKQETLKRDQKRLSDLSTIITRLKIEFSADKQYPRSLVDILGDIDSIKDPSTGQQYGYRQDRGGAGFTLHVQLETDAAARAYQKARDEAAPIDALPADPQLLIEVHEDTPYTYTALSFSDISPYPLGFELDAVYQYLPVEVDAYLKIAGQSESDVAQSNDSTFNATGSLALGGTSFAAGVDILKKADAFFVRVNEAPSLGFFDLAALKSKWIKAVPEDTYGTFLGGLFYREDDKTVDQQSARVINQYQLVLQLLKEENLIQVIQEFPLEKTENERLYHYAIKLDRSKFANFYKRLTEVTKQEFGDDAVFKFNEETLNYVQSPEFTQLYEVFEKNVQLELWIDADNFTPRKISYAYRLVPPDSVLKLKDKQFRFKLAVGLSNVNQPVAVEMPAGTISVDEARMLLTGETIEQIKYERQVAQVGAIRDAIELYFKHTGRDPQTLSELTQKINDVRGSPAPTPTNNFFSNTQLKDLQEKNKPFLSILPKDIFTGTDYGYTSDGKTYTLIYQIKLPPKREDALQDYEYDFARRAHVEGTNTATEKALSLEADAANNENPR